jgi:hypothetical protein
MTTAARDITGFNAAPFVRVRAGAVPAHDTVTIRQDPYRRNLARAREVG